MVDVVVFLQWAVCPSDDPWGALPQVVAHHRLLVISPVEILKRGRGKLNLFGPDILSSNSMGKRELTQGEMAEVQKYITTRLR